MTEHKNPVRAVIDGHDIYISLDDLLLTLNKLRIQHPEQDSTVSIIENTIATWGLNVSSKRNVL